MDVEHDLLNQTKANRVIDGARRIAHSAKIGRPWVVRGIVDRCPRQLEDFPVVCCAMLPASFEAAA